MTHDKRAMSDDTVHASAESATPAAGAKAGVPQQLLNEGEVVILAIKPSVWFVILNAWPAIAVAAAVMALGYVFLPMFDLGLDYPRRTLAMLCVAAVLMQLFISSCQWTGRLYVLTNVRVLRVRGVFRVDVFQCPLRNVRQATLAGTRLERLCGVGTIVFDVETPTEEPCWFHVARPGEVNDMVQEALRKARR